MTRSSAANINDEEFSFSTGWVEQTWPIEAYYVQVAGKAPGLNIFDRQHQRRGVQLLELSHDYERHNLPHFWSGS